MTHDTAHSPVTDELLVAYLDGELSPDQRQQIDGLLVANSLLAARLSHMRLSELPFKEAFDSMLDQAPVERLQALLEMAAPDTRQGINMSRRGFIATAAGFIVAGVIADRLFAAWHGAEPPQGWRGSVAKYMTLYTPQTLENLSSDSASHTAQLALVGSQLGLPLDTQAVTLPGADFRRAQILDYEGQLIGQLTYLDPRHGPLALCITSTRKGAAGIASEERLGMNVVFWANPSHAFMLIGRNPFEDLQIMARSVQSRLPA